MLINECKHVYLHHPCFPFTAASWGRVRYRIPYFGDSG